MLRNHAEWATSWSFLVTETVTLFRAKIPLKSTVVIPPCARQAQVADGLQSQPAEPHSLCQLNVCEQEVLTFSCALRPRGFLPLLKPVLIFVNMGQIIQFYAFKKFNYLSMSSCIVAKLEQHSNISLYFHNFSSLLIPRLWCADACYCTDAAIRRVEKPHS